MSDTSRNNGNGQLTLQQERMLARRELKRALGRAHSGRERLRLLLDSEHAEAIVPTMPAEELFFTIKEVGLADSLELVQLASPRQFRTFVDLDAWKGDRLDDAVALQWLRAARADPDDDRYRGKRSHLDLELVELLLKNAVKVHDLEEDEDPELQGNFFRSTEGRYVIEFNVEGDDYLAIKALLDDMYAEDPARVARMLEAVRWELPTELEENSLHWRNARLADLGFPALPEALSFFAYLDPDAALPVLEHAPAVPEGFFLSRMQQSGLFFDEAVRRVPEEDRELVERQLVTVLNAVMVVEAVDPGDNDAVAKAMSAARDLLSLGLEHAAKGDPETGAGLLAGVPLKRVFQVGASLGLKLKFRADRLMKSGQASWPSAPGVPLFDSPAAEVVLAVRRKRPRYPVVLDDPSEPEGLRPFRDLSDIARVGEQLDQASRIAELMAKLGFEAGRAEEALAEAGATAALSFLHFSDLLLTAVVREALGESFAFEPVPRARVAELGARLFRIQAGEAIVLPAVAEKLRGAVARASAALSPAHGLSAQAFADTCLGRLLEEAGRPYAAAGKIDPELPLPFVVR